MQKQQGRAVGSQRLWEIVVAVCFFAFGALVAWDSRRIGAAWAEDGPQAGYFPFYIGLIICISAVAILIDAARPETAIPLYERFIAALRARGLETATGEFGADMQVEIHNDGPVTLTLERA